MINKQSTAITRRQLAMGTVAAGALLFVPFGAPAAFGSGDQEISLADFMEISRRLTGRQDLDQDVGALYLWALQDRHTNSASLDRLAVGEEDGSPDLSPIKQQILRQWYTGIYEAQDGPQVATFDRALIWDAMGIDQPIGTCRGQTGYWSQPPAA